MNELQGLPQWLINLFALISALSLLSKNTKILSWLGKDLLDRREHKQKLETDDHEFIREIARSYQAQNARFLAEFDDLLENLVAAVEKLDVRHLTTIETTNLHLAQLNQKLDNAIKANEKLQND